MIPEGTRPLFELRDELGSETVWRQLESGALMALHMDSCSGCLHAIGREQWRRSMVGMEYDWSRTAPRRSALELLTAGNLSWLYSGRGMPRHKVGDDPVLVRIEQPKTIEPAQPAINKGGAPEKADWEVIEEAFRAEVAKRGPPEKLNEEGWQRQADVERWLADVLDREGKTIGESTIKKHAKKFLQKVSKGQ